MANEEVTNCQELRDAIGEYQAGGEYNADEERYLIQKSVELGCTKDIPDDFGMR
jgi:hypothetical protein